MFRVTLHEQFTQVKYNWKYINILLSFKFYSIHSTRNVNAHKVFPWIQSHDHLYEHQRNKLKHMKIIHII